MTNPQNTQNTDNTDNTDRDRAIEVARGLAERLASEGAEAVYLTGSWARGDAHPESDLDLRVIGKEQPKSLSRHEGFLISSEWMPEDEHRKALTDPEMAGSVVPGWRSAEILHDPAGTAAAIKAEAERWTWAQVDRDQKNEYVASELTKYAEEIHTLIGNLDQDLRLGAATVRCEIASNLAPALAVHLEILYETEKELWDLVADAMGDAWRDTQGKALAENNEDFDTTCRATFELFRMAIDKTRSIFDDRQQEVVQHAERLAEKAAAALATERPNTS